jgi:hypothetical protein
MAHHNHEVLGELFEGDEELLIVLPIDGVQPGLACTGDLYIPLSIKV